MEFNLMEKRKERKKLYVRGKSRSQRKGDENIPSEELEEFTERTEDGKSHELNGGGNPETISRTRLNALVAHISEKSVIRPREMPLEDEVVEQFSEHLDYDPPWKDEKRCWREREATRLRMEENSQIASTGAKACAMFLGLAVVVVLITKQTIGGRLATWTGRFSM
eukprot:TRINITY_DN3650_c0_g1_i2.p1 TRINITY_DN3650_c0_g1~~TRINITY_DN3650_c0_g1_i2.p1  ORF type:complete len:166 (-),score=37.16 TRINITY_DN3650_c0_g1_i2:18-515(-)